MRVDFSNARGLRYTKDQVYLALCSTRSSTISLSSPVFLAWDPSVNKDMKSFLTNIPVTFSWTASAMQLIYSLAARSSCLAIVKHKENYLFSARQCGYGSEKYKPRRRVLFFLTCFLAHMYFLRAISHHFQCGVFILLFK